MDDRSVGGNAVIEPVHDGAPMVYPAVGDTIGAPATVAPSTARTAILREEKRHLVSFYAHK